MTDARYERLSLLIAIGAGVLVVGSLSITLVVGWAAYANTFEVVRDIVIAPLGGGITFALTRWSLATARKIGYRFFMPQPKADSIVDDALARGWLPNDYDRAPHRVRKLARTIQYDRRVGLNEDEIARDLRDLV